MEISSNLVAFSKNTNFKNSYRKTIIKVLNFRFVVQEVPSNLQRNLQSQYAKVMMLIHIMIITMMMTMTLWKHLAVNLLNKKQVEENLPTIVKQSAWNILELHVNLEISVVPKVE